MKESKKFFNNNNRLNKGYPRLRNPQELDQGFYRKKFEHILPSIDVIEAYENIYPGTLEKLVDMAEKEQLHRHQIEIKHLEINERLMGKAKLCALIFMIFLVSSFMISSFYGKFINILALGGLITISCVSFIYNKLSKKKSYNKR